MRNIIPSEDKNLITDLITALAHQTEPLPPAITAQLQQLGQISPSQLTDAIQDFLDELDYQPLLESVNAIEKQRLDNPLLDNQPQRGIGAPPPKSKPEHNAEIFNNFTLVTSAADIRQAAQAAIERLNRGK